MEFPMYEVNLDVEELLDWIRALDKYFDYEDVEEDKKVKHVVTRLNCRLTDAIKESRKSKVGI
jgi:DNA-binding transcriptional regulator WhiA